ncbi:MAG TPA: class I SAM-dependent methyltransferase [Burkholderiales bacterium]|nr:class I SAM-dependent methyltransferase [Burkholderiales bacterium]
MKFEQSSYWQRRVTEDADLGVVGHRSLGRGYNEYIYRRRTECLKDVLRRLDIKPSQCNVLDLGCGSGYYAVFWKEAGVTELTGIDIAVGSVDHLREKFPEYRFLQADITQVGAAARIGGCYSIVTLFDVMYHISDDAAALNALKTAASALKPTGLLLLFDQLAPRDYSLLPHVKFRGKMNYIALLDAAGLEIVSRQPLFVFLAPPVFGFKAADVLVSGLYKIVGAFIKNRESAGRRLGKAVYELDQFLIKKGVSLPNHELIAVRKRATGALA